MKNLLCKDGEIEVIENTPFHNDELHRDKIAEVLTDVVNAYAHSGAVLAIDGEWGTGKTTFVKMWCQYLKNNRYKTLYFNAWETDFIKDPLIALMGELKDIFGSDNPKWREFIKSIGKISVKAGGGCLKSFIEKKIGVSIDAINVAVDEVANICHTQIDAYEGRKAEMAQFKTKLSELVASTAQTNKHPLIFFIDELDRCSPNYAVKVLERVKHLFEVPNIIFVLAVNINQLQHAVKGFYGSSDIDGAEYLKRFIDLHYNLPAPNMRDYVKVLYDKHSFDDFFECEARKESCKFSNEGGNFCVFIQDVLSCTENLNLRSVNKIIAYTRIVLQGFSVKERFDAHLVFLLCYIKFVKPILYNSICKGDLTIQGLLDTIEQEFPLAMFDDKQGFDITHFLTYAAALLLLRYNYPSRGQKKEQNFYGTELYNSKSRTFPLLPTKFDKQKLDDALTDYMYNGYDKYYIDGLSLILERINLTQNLQF